MGNKYLQQFTQSLTHNLTVFSGYVDLSAAGAVTSSVIKGGTVTKTGTGEYTLTLDDTFNAGVVAHAKLQAAVAVDLIPQIKSFDPVSAKTLVINLNASAVPTNPAAACRLYIWAAVRNSSVAQ